MSLQKGEVSEANPGGQGREQRERKKRKNGRGRTCRALWAQARG